MVHKFVIVFVVVALVTPSSVLLSPVTFNGFSEKGYALLDQLQSEDLAARARSFIGFGSFVNLLKNRTLDTSPHQDLSPFADALSIVVEATEIIYSSALLVSSGNCDGFEMALNETRDQLRGVIELLIDSIALAKGGRYDENRYAIQNNLNLTEPRLVNAYAISFEFFRCCISDSSNEFENVIDEVQAKVNENIHLRNDALYAAIEGYSILTSECSEDEAAAALVLIDKSLFVILVTAVDTIEHIFSLYETSYILTHVNCDYVAHGVFEIRLARKRTSDKLEEVVNVVYLAITGRLLQHTSHHEIESGNSTLDDPTQGIAADLIRSAEEHFLEAVSHTLPNSVDNAMVAQILLPHILSKIISHYYNGMDLAEADSLPLNLSLSAIRTVEEVQSLLTSFVVHTCFNIIGSDASTEARLTNLQNRVIVSLHAANGAVFDLIEVLSGAAHAKGGATEDDFNKIHSDLSIAIASVRNAAKVQLHAVLYKYLVEQKC